MVTETLPKKQYRQVLAFFGMRSFSTHDFVERVRVEFPNTWTALLKKYGLGGKGAGKHYTANSAVSKVLDYWSERGELDKLDYRPAPRDWGSPVIRFWTLKREALGGGLFPDEINPNETYQEGTKKQVVVNRYERDPAARQQCIEHHGLTCAACEFDFEQRYGSHGAGFIHVHHLKPLSSIGKSYKVDPAADLIPVCPNCHAMIHYKGKTLTIAAVKKLLAATSKNVAL